MGQWIQLMGSTIISGYIIFIILNLNSTMSSTTSRYYQNSLNQRNAITIGQTVEYDFYKIGFNTSGNKILQADSSTLKFVCDLNNAGGSDTMTYSLSATGKVSNTPNPNDKLLYRQHNSGTSYSLGTVTRFYMQYYDSLLNNLSYTSLTSQTTRSTIRVIRAYIKTEIASQADKSYYPLEWQKDFKPRNMK
jgi:hypothetical protein